MTRRLSLISALLFCLSTQTVAGDSVQDLYRQSYALEASYSYESALAQVDRIPAEEADAYLVPLRKGWLLYLLGRYGESVEAYSAAVSANPGAVEARLGLTLPLMALRQWSDAEKACRDVLDKAPGQYLAASRLAYVLYSSGRYGEAEVVYAELVRLYPGDVEMRAGLGWALLKQGKTAGARGHFKWVLHTTPDHASAQEGVALL